MARKILLVLGSIVLFGILWIVGLIVYSVYANQAADKAVAAFCGKVALQSPIAKHVADADKQEIRHRTMDDGNRFEFLFYGAIFHAKACSVDVVDGKVTATQILVYDD